MRLYLGGGGLGHAPMYVAIYSHVCRKGEGEEALSILSLSLSYENYASSVGEYMYNNYVTRSCGY